MPRRKIPLFRINADDFGLHSDINRGILDCLENRLINSVSISVVGEGFNEQEVGWLRGFVQKGLKFNTGLHLQLTEGNALTGISSLTNPEGFFPAYVNQFVKSWILGKIKKNDIQKEWETQIEAYLHTGLPLDHLDSHQHVHLLPGLWPLTLALAKKYKVEVIRTSYESLYSSIKSHSLRFFFFQALAFLRYLSLPRSKKTLGALCSCDFEVEKIHKLITEMILRKKSCEIMVHPGVGTSALNHRFKDWHIKNWDREISELQKLSKLMESFK